MQIFKNGGFNWFFEVFHKFPSFEVSSPELPINAYFQFFLNVYPTFLEKFEKIWESLKNGKIPIKTCVNVQFSVDFST